MRFATILCCILLIAGAAWGQQRPNTQNMTCAQATGLVASHGAVVMRTGPHTGDRFVASRAFCEFDERLEPARVPTLDHPRCPLGYTCEIGTPFFEGFRRW